MKSYEYLPVTSLLFILACIAARTGAQKRLNPIILVPGDGGSQLEAKLNKTTSVAWYCWKTTNYFFPLWLNFELLVPKALNCLVDNMRLVYDKKTRTTSNSPGVQIRVPGFGETSTVEWVDPSEYKITSVFHEIVETLVSLGYKRNLSIRGAPYDFRKAPNELGDYMKSLKQLIEHTYYENSNKSVILMAHSMGNAVVLHLLNHMQKAWKAKFIRSHVSLAGVWGGAVKSVRLMISGDSLQVPLVSPEDVRRQQQSMPSTAWLMPSDEFWHKNEVIVVSPGRNYTIKDLKQLFIDINYTTGYMMWQDTNKLIKPLKAPGVELYCLHGNHVPTPVQLVYTNETWLKGFPKSVNEDGDGTVNLRSLQGCLRFRKQQKQPVKYKMFGWVEHTDILRNTDVLEYIKGVVSEINNKEDKAVKNGLYQN